MSFNTALSGLKAAAADLGVISNNIANASTNGFKQSRAEFADVYAVSSSGTSSNAIGSGVRLAAVSQQFTQGTISYTDNNLDLAINGDGFFVLEDNGSRLYSRAGSFQVDRDGYVVNNLSQRLIGFQADATGAITGAIGDMQLDTSNIQPNATQDVDVSVNVDSAAAVPGNPTATTGIDISSGDLDTDPTATNNFAGLTVIDDYGYEHDLDLSLTAFEGTSADFTGLITKSDYSGAGETATIDFTYDNGSTTAITLNANYATDDGVLGEVVSQLNTATVAGRFTYDAGTDVITDTLSPYTVDVSTVTDGTTASGFATTQTGTERLGEYDVTYTVDGVASLIPQTITLGGNQNISIDLTGNASNLLNAPDLNIDLSFANMTQTTPAAAVSTVIADGVDKQVIAFDPDEPASYNNSTSLSVYDSQGGTHLLTTYYRKMPEPNKWEVHHFMDGAAVYPNDDPDLNFIAEFSPGGSISQLWARDDSSQPDQPTVADSAIATLSFNMTGIDVDTPGNDVDPIDLSVDVSALTQYGADFAVFALSQDGYSTGRLSGVDISNDGTVFARYSNGQSQALGQVALASFANSQGLSQLGDTNWAESFDSGAALVGQPGTASLGLVQGGALEDSNVDLSGQLVKMITSQRNYQANAQVISTNDQITQTIINIR